MNSPRPWSYHQKATAVATRSATSAFAMRLRSSVRCAINDIVASGSRGGRRRRMRDAEPAWVTVVLPGRGGSAGGAVGRAGLLGSGPELGGARLGRVARAEPPARGVVVLHALHLALEDAQRATERARGVRQLLVAEQQQDR